MKWYNLVVRMLCIIGKSLLYLLTGIITLFVCLMFFFYVSEWLWPEWNGSHNLGKNVYMIEWDGGNVIVYSTEISGRTCYSGSPLIPARQDAYDKKGHWKESLNQWNDSLGVLSEYVVDAKADDEWIIAKTDNKKTQKKKFYIIHKNFDPDTIDAQEIIQSHIWSFDDSILFENSCQNNCITVKW